MRPFGGRDIANDIVNTESHLFAGFTSFESEHYMEKGNGPESGFCLLHCMVHIRERDQLSRL